MAHVTVDSNQQQALLLPKLWPGQRIKSEIRNLRTISALAYMALGALGVLGNALVWTSSGPADVGRVIAGGGLALMALGSCLIANTSDQKARRLEDSIADAVVKRFEALQEANRGAEVTALVRKAAALD